MIRFNTSVFMPILFVCCPFNLDIKGNRNVHKPVSRLSVLNHLQCIEMHFIWRNCHRLNVCDCKIIDLRNVQWVHSSPIKTPWLNVDCLKQSNEGFEQKRTPYDIYAISELICFNKRKPELLFSSPLATSSVHYTKSIDLFDLTTKHNKIMQWMFESHRLVYGYLAVHTLR